MAKVVIYARVSTQGQDYERQLAELREYARKMEYEVVMEFCEKVSGAKTVAERQALTELLSFVECNKVDKVLIYECSRLSRRAIDFLTVIENLTAKKISVYILQNGLETLLPNGQPNPIDSWLWVFLHSSTVWSVASSEVVWRVVITITEALVARLVVKRVIARARKR